MIFAHGFNIVTADLPDRCRAAYDADKDQKPPEAIIAEIAAAREVLLLLEHLFEDKPIRMVDALTLAFASMIESSDRPQVEHFGTLARINGAMAKLDRLSAVAGAEILHNIGADTLRAAEQLA